MAIHLMDISGKIAKVVFYKMNGKNIVRSAPKKAKRTKPMKQRSLNFGIAARAGRAFRLIFHDIIPFPKNRSMQSRLSGAISKWMGNRELSAITAEKNISYLADFQFNDKTSIRKKWKLIPKAVNLGVCIFKLEIPAFVPSAVIHAPEKTVSVEIQVNVAAVMLKTGLAAESFPLSFDIPYTDVEIPARMIDIPLKMEKGTLIITVCALIYTIAGKNGVEKLRDPAFMPASVIDASYY